MKKSCLRDTVHVVLLRGTERGLAHIEALQEVGFQFESQSHLQQGLHCQ